MSLAVLPTKAVLLVQDSLVLVALLVVATVRLGIALLLVVLEYGIRSLVERLDGSYVPSTWRQSAIQLGCLSRLARTHQEDRG